MVGGTAIRRRLFGLAIRSGCSLFARRHGRLTIGWHDMSGRRLRKVKAPPFRTGRAASQVVSALARQALSERECYLFARVYIITSSPRYVMTCCAR